MRLVVGRDAKKEKGMNQKKIPPWWIWCFIIVIAISCIIGFWIGVKKKPIWEYQNPRDRFVQYYRQKTDGVIYRVVRDDVRGNEYLVVKNGYGCVVIKIK